MPSLLYPAYQKFYSAICSLERFNKDQDFFENIASLDTFFSEYRSITLVMQKSLAHTSYIDIYKEKVANGCFDPWLNKQRVKSVHTHPVEFSKKIDITIYFPNREFSLLSESYSVDNDVQLCTLNDSLKEVFSRINPIEVFFSASYAFPEKDTGADVLKKALLGIETMQIIMDEMYAAVGENCSICEQLREKISHSHILHTPTDFLTVDDYVYYPTKDEFKRGRRLVGLLDGSMVPSRSPLKTMNHFHSITEDDYFQKFVIMHILIGTTDLMPTFMLVYQDKTFQLITFHADIKTTFYRKINEIAETVKSDDVLEVYYMMTYVMCDYSEKNIVKSSKERLASGKEEFLTFMKVDSNLNEEEYVFDAAILRDHEKLANRLLKGSSNKLNLGADNMMPIISAFRKKR